MRISAWNTIPLWMRYKHFNTTISYVISQLNDIVKDDILPVQSRIVHAIDGNADRCLRNSHNDAGCTNIRDGSTAQANSDNITCKMNIKIIEKKILK